MEIKLVENLNKTNGMTNSTELGPSSERNKENEVKINSDEHLIFSSHKKQKKKRLNENSKKINMFDRCNLVTRTRCFD